MKKIVTFFAMAAFVVALSSCGNKSTESTEGAADANMEAAPAADTTVTNTMESTDTTQHMSTDTTIKK